jgi:hypothetical protein
MLWPHQEPKYDIFLKVHVLNRKAVFGPCSSWNHLPQLNKRSGSVQRRRQSHIAYTTIAHDCVRPKRNPLIIEKSSLYHSDLMEMVIWLSRLIFLFVKGHRSYAAHALLSKRQTVRQLESDYR